MHHVWGLVSQFNKMLAISFTETHVSSHIVAVVRDRYTRVGWCLTATDHCYVSLGRMKSCWHKRRSDHCDAIAWKLHAVHSERKLTIQTKGHLQQLNGTKTNRVVIWNDSTGIKPSKSVHVPKLIPSMRLQLSNTEAVIILNGFLWTRWPRRQVQRE